MIEFAFIYFFLQKQKMILIIKKTSDKSLPKIIKNFFDLRIIQTLNAKKPNFTSFQN